MSNTMWMVRAGEDAFLIDDFKNKGFIAIGWINDEDLSRLTTPEAMKKKVQEIYPEFNEGHVLTTARQINNFISDIKVGDKVISYNPDSREYHIGEVIGNYEYNASFSKYHHIRKVKWLGKVPRDVLLTETKNTLGSLLTIFRIGIEAYEDILGILSGKRGEEIKETIQVEEEKLDKIKEDTVNTARDFIKDKIQKFSWEDVQELVAGILRGMGYKTKISSRGPDRGKDIEASPDGLGLEEPRIIVEVKHRDGQIGSKEIRSFAGLLRVGHKGLYVSTGGFSKEAKYEADRSNIPLTLIDIDELVNLIIQYYDNFDVDTKILIPLTKIYWPTR